MSWKAGLSRYLRALRFFACPESPSSRGVLYDVGEFLLLVFLGTFLLTSALKMLPHRQFYTRNYDEIKLLNPNFPMMLRTTENAMPAVTTELQWTIDHVLKFMLQAGRFRDTNGTVASDRVEAAKAYLATNWDELALLRWKKSCFDPERPGLDEDTPGWRDDPDVKEKLGPYLAMKAHVAEQVKTFKGGPNNEYIRAENALLMCQRVDLWCSGPLEVERAVQHLYKLGRVVNDLEVEYPDYIVDFVPGADDMEDS